LIGAAVLAPSTWNSQPWRFEVDGETIRLVADSRRALPITDPAQKGMMISLGAALENLLVTARAYGLRPTVTYFPRGAASPVVAEITWATGDVRRDRALFNAIPDRRTNRREYDGRGIFAQNRAQLLAQMSESFRMHWMDDRDRLRELGDLAQEAVESRVLDRRAEAEQMAWMRFGDDARRTGDGVTVDALEVGGLAHWFAGRYFNPHSWFLRFGAQAAGRHARDGFRSAGAAVLLTSVQTGNNAWLTGGQAYERFALRATTLGIAHQPVNEPIDIERFRGDVLHTFAAAGEEPFMLVRLGHAKRPDASARRSVAFVSSFRNS
jgi:nitroreductase